MKYLLIISLFLLGQLSVASNDVHYKIEDHVRDYMKYECENIKYSNEKLSAIEVESHYEEDKSGYFYVFNYVYDVYYGAEVIGEAFNFGEGADAFGGSNEWDISVSCPKQ